jgi:regulatory protein
MQSKIDKNRNTDKNSNGMNRAYNYAVYLLGIRLRTEGELRERMKQKGYPLAIVDEVINYLKDQRFLDDQRFAEIFLDNLKKYKNFGFYGIKKKMMEKRLPSSIIENVLSQGLPIEEETKIARRFLRKQKFTPSNAAERQSAKDESFDRADKNKIARSLANRGFRTEIIKRFF